MYRKYIKYLITLIVSVLAIIFGNTVQKISLLAEDNTEYAKAIVKQLVEDNPGGSQRVILSVKSGKYTGMDIEADSSNGYLYGANCQEGTKVIVRISQYEGNVSGSVYGYDRAAILYILIGLFLITMWIIGGRKGINSVIALVFTFIIIIKFYVPIMYIGVNPFIAAVVSSILIVIISMVLIGDMSRKTVCAILGTVCGVVIAGAIAVIFGKLSHISGYNVEDIETMIYIGQNSKLDIGGLLFSGILMASLGAVMDVAMSVSSTVNEIHSKNKELTQTELFKSGINVGRDMIGTMSNTLILAFIGNSINTLLVIYSYSLPYLQVVNMYAIGIEILRGISGTMGVILTVPFVSYISARMLKNK